MKDRKKKDLDRSRKIMKKGPKLVNNHRKLADTDQNH